MAENVATTAGTATVPRQKRSALELARLLPSGRSLALGFILLASGTLAYVLARQTAVFALRAVEVRGAPPALERQVRSALGPLHGQSLLSLDSQEIERRLAELPAVRSASYDRAFPHTLRVSVSAERPVAVLRSGARAWLLSAHAKVLQVLRPPLPNLPRLWVGQAAKPRLGTVPAEPTLPQVANLVASVAKAEPALARRITTVRWQEGGLTFVLRSGTELRLGSAVHLRLKLAVAARLLRVLPQAERQRVSYIDLSVPTRPVAAS